jgi:hypothetical protein
LNLDDSSVTLDYEINYKDFKNIQFETNQTMYIVFVYSTWSLYCKKIKSKIFNLLSGEKNLKFYNGDLDDQTQNSLIRFFFI